MRIFDSHCHIETGLEAYNIEASPKNIIFNTVESYQQHKDHVAKTDTISLIFDYRNHLESIKGLLNSKAIQALKIHSRRQKISSQQYPALMAGLEALNPTVPVIIDSFYHGADIEFQPDMHQAITIAKRFSHIPVIIAHAGGYNVLQYFYHLKELENIYFELSFSLFYLKESSVFADFRNLLKYGDKSRILFGTDYPFADPAKQLNIFRELADDLDLDDTQRDLVLFRNAEKIFKPTP